MNSTSFDHYVLTIRYIKKMKRTVESLHARLSNDIRFDSNIFKKIATW